MGIVSMTRFMSGLRTAVVLGGLVLIGSSSVAEGALSSTKGTGDQPSGMIWLYFAAFVLGTLGLAFMPSKRKEAE